MKIKHIAAVLAVMAVSRLVKAGDDPVKIAPNNYKVMLENDRVRVSDVMLKAGDKIQQQT